MPEPIKSPRLPQPLTPETLRGLMREPAYRDATHPRFPTYQRLVKRGFEILYPGPERRDDTGMIIDVKPLPPERVAHLVEQTNREIEDAEGGFERPRNIPDGAVHVEAHTRDGGKTEVSDYWRAAPGQGDADKSAPETQNDSSEDVLQGQSSEDTLPDPNTPRETPKDAFVAPDPDKLVRDWSGTWQGPNDAEKRQCVGLVKAAVPEIGATPNWREGEKIVGPGDPPLKPGTAIATFDKDGKYANISGESHAAIFLGYGTQGGQQGIHVLDQFGGKEATPRFIRFDNPGAKPVNQAERFAVIKRRN